MKQELRALCDLQAIDSQLVDAKKALAALDSGASLQQGLTQTEAILANRAAALHKSEIEFKDSELKLKSLEAKKKDLEKRLYDGKTSNPKELSGIQQEIEMLKRNREKLDERILELYDIIDQQKKTVKEAEDRREQFKTRLEQVLTQQKSKADKLNADVKRLTAEREQTVKELPPVILRRYDSIRTHAGGIGIAEVKDGRCGACKTALTPYLHKQLKEGTDYHFCESCGRLLCLENN